MFNKISCFYVLCVKWFALIASTIFFGLALGGVCKAITFPHHTSWIGKERGAKLDVVKAWNTDKLSVSELAPFDCSQSEASSFNLSSEELASMKKYYAGIVFKDNKINKDLAAKWASCSLIRQMNDFEIDRSLFTDVVEYAASAGSRAKNDINPVLFLFTAADQYRLEHDRWKKEQRDFSLDYYGAGIAFGFFVSFIFTALLLILVRIEVNTRPQ